MSLCRRVLCFALGGHMPIAKSQDGRLRMVCAYECGWSSRGIETRGQELQRMARQVRPFMNLTISRGRRRRVA